MLLFLHINFLVEVGEGRRQLNTTHFFVDVFQEVSDGNLRPKIKHHKVLTSGLNENNNYFTSQIFSLEKKKIFRFKRAINDLHTIC